MRPTGRTPCCSQHPWDSFLLSWCCSTIRPFLVRHHWLGLVILERRGQLFYLKGRVHIPPNENQGLTKNCAWCAFWKKIFWRACKLIQLKMDDKAPNDVWLHLLESMLFEPIKLRTLLIWLLEKLLGMLWRLFIGPYFAHLYLRVYLTFC